MAFHCLLTKSSEKRWPGGRHSSMDCWISGGQPENEAMLGKSWQYFIIRCENHEMRDLNAVIKELNR